MNDELIVKGSNARLASKELAKLSSDIKNEALLRIANNLESRCQDIIQVNAKDIDAGKEKGLTDALLDRLLLNQDRIVGMANDLRNIVNIPDPVGVIIDQRVLPNGLNVSRRRVPLGVIGAIYESRPNVTIDISALNTLNNCANSSILYFLRNLPALNILASSLKVVKLIFSADTFIERNLYKLNNFPCFPTLSWV